MLQTTTRYKKIFEDNMIVAQLGAEVLRIITKNDNSAYDIPLKPIREALFFSNEGKRVLCNDCVNLYQCGHIYRFQLNRHGNCPAYNEAKKI